jgi:murein DD-endopeptidase MepM/ murein hydrolase activator NlpD
MTTALVGAGVVALVTGTVMPDTPEPDDLALVDATAIAQAAERADAAAGDRASRSDPRDAAGFTIEQWAPDVYVLPLRSYTLTSKFGPRWERQHTGIDLAAPGGTPYYSIANGRVIMARYYGGYGYCIMIDHGGGVVSLYGHSSQMLVKEGQTVQAGEMIGKVGTTGHSFGTHLHFEIRIDGVQKDPIPFLKGKGADIPGKTDALTQ